MRVLAAIWTTLVAVILFALGIWIFMTNSSSWLLATGILVQSIGAVSMSAMLIKDSRWE